MAGLCICKSAVFFWNNLFAFQNQSLCGQHSRWGLWGIIRAEGPDSTVQSKPWAPAITCWILHSWSNTSYSHVCGHWSHTQGTWDIVRCKFAVVPPECCINGWGLWKLAAMTVNMWLTGWDQLLLQVKTEKRVMSAVNVTLYRHTTVLPGRGNVQSGLAVSPFTEAKLYPSTDWEETFPSALSLTAQCHNNVLTP